MQKENAELKEKAAAAAAGDIFKDVKEVNGHRYIASQVSVSDAGALRTFADNWKQKDYSDVLVLVAAIGDKVNVLVASKTKEVHAGNVIKELAPIVDGRGGGKPDMAMAGGSNQAKSKNSWMQLQINCSMLFKIRIQSWSFLLLIL